MKVLILSHNVISTYQNMGKTFLSLFSEFDKEELCQFYIYPSYPDVDVCSSYYRVTDKEVLKSIFTLKKVGNEITKDKIHSKPEMYENPQDEHFYRDRKNKAPIRRILRDVIWKVGCWNNLSLQKWLDKEEPTVIFVAPGAAKFIYDIALRIAQNRKIPIVVYVCDEYYFVKPGTSLIDKIQLRMRQNKIEELIGASSHIVTISKELEELYSQKFSISATTIMTGSKYTGNPVAYNKIPKEISYFGNIRCNRFVSLKDVGAYSGKTAHPFQKNGAPFRLKLSTTQ